MPERIDPPNPLAHQLARLAGHDLIVAGEETATAIIKNATPTETTEAIDYLDRLGYAYHYEPKQKQITIWRTAK